mmetsp:Transcript_13200/g.25814  ORF Transcript_13200/g.25814 Transcript_13200/m.25814 type:complete len:276 (+) Transcript_13200:1009-1836(+)
MVFFDAGGLALASALLGFALASALLGFAGTGAGAAAFLSSNGILCFLQNFFIVSRKARFGNSAFVGTGSFVSGSVSCAAYHSVIAVRSKVLPFSLMTGSTMMSMVRGHSKSSGMSTSEDSFFFAPRNSCRPFLNSFRLIVPDPSSSSFLNNFIASSTSMSVSSGTFSSFLPSSLSFSGSVFGFEEVFGFGVAVAVFDLAGAGFGVLVAGFPALLDFVGLLDAAFDVAVGFLEFLLEIIAGAADFLAAFGFSAFDAFFESSSDLSPSTCDFFLLIR